MSVKMYDGEDKEFLKACRNLDKVTYTCGGEQVIEYKPTRRQYSKWLQKRGIVYNARGDTPVV